jgi:predicted molibdopterin-dependent oxidoreductase YjgC
MPTLASGDVATALSIAVEAAKDEKKSVCVVYAVHPFDARAAAEGAKAAANLAIALCGEAAAQHLYILPSEANVWGARDMGVDPHLAPGHVDAPSGGMAFADMIDAVRAGTLKAMVVVGDNPLMFGPDRARVEAALSRLELLVVIDSVLTDTAAKAHAVFADVPTYSKAGTFTNAERRVNRLHAAMDALGDARPGSLALIDLANAIGELGSWKYAHPDAVTDEIAEKVAAYERFSSAFGGWGKQHAAGTPTRTERQPVASAEDAREQGYALLTTGRTLYTSLEGAALHSEEADKLHREEFLEVHPADAAALGLRDGDEVVLAGNGTELAVHAKVSGRVMEGVVFLPSYYNGGAVNRLLDRNGAATPVRLQVAAAV